MANSYIINLDSFSLHHVGDGADVGDMVFKYSTDSGNNYSEVARIDVSKGLFLANMAMIGVAVNASYDANTWDNVFQVLSHSNAAIINKPANTSDYGMILEIPQTGDSSGGVQLHFDRDSDLTHIRYRSSGTWSSWNNFGSGSGVSDPLSIGTINANVINSNTITIKSVPLHQVVNATANGIQNNWSTSIANSASIQTTLNITADNGTLIITGLDTSGWEVGKRIVLRNAHPTHNASSYAIILGNGDTRSSANNRFLPSDDLIPIIIMPQEEITFYNTGTGLNLSGGTRYGTGANIFDVSFGSPTFTLANLGGATTSLTSLLTTNGRAIGGYRNTVSTNGDVSVKGTSYGRPFGSHTGCCFIHGTVYGNHYNETDWKAYLGFTSHYLDGFNAASANAVTDHIGWRFERGVSSNPQQVTINNGTVTATDIVFAGFDLDDGFSPMRLGAFVNGDWTRVDFFWMEPFTNLWSAGAVHTTNIPGSTSARRVDIGSFAIKFGGSGGVARTQIVSMVGLMGEAAWST